MRWLYPRKLYHQIAVLISVTIVAVFFTFGSLAAKKQTEFLKSIMTENAMRMTQALSESCIRYLLISDYAGLDELLKKFIIMSDSLQIRVYRDDGKVLSEVSKESATSSPVRSVGKITTQVPEGATTQIVVSDGRMIIWQPVVSIKVIGWVRIAYSLKNINDMHREIWIATGKAAAFWTLLSITFFMFVFNPLARAIRGLSDFARQLGSHKGEQIDIRHSSYEIQQLCQALNCASADLYIKEQEVTSHRDHLEELVVKRTVELQKEISQRRKVEEILKESEERLRTLINATPDIVCFKDGEGRWLEANEADLELFQLNGVDYRGKKDSELAGFSDFYREALLSCEVTDERAWQAQAPTREDETIPRPDGTAKVFDVIKVPIFHKDKKRKGLVVLGRDITERKTLEQRIQQSQKMESIGNLAGGIAHDFNNILFPILGYAEMLLGDITEDSPFKNSLEGIYTSAIRAKGLVKQILTFSRQDTTELQLMNMQPIIKEALKLIRSTIPTTIEIKQDINPDCGVIKADPTQIHQIVMNLATNAYHAMEENGGELKVSLKEMEFETLDLIDPNMAPGIYACLTVADTGVGMDKRITDKIFDPFFTTKVIGKGTGMGLSVVHGIVTSMGGTIQIYSEPGKGTEFHVYLPVEKTLSEEQVTISKAQIQGGIEQILLVDDEEEILTMEKQTLERLGYQVTSRTSSLEALEVFRKNPDKFDLVITDMAMPNMPGDRLSVELTKMRPGIPVLLCTGFSENISEERAASLGIKGFLFKPIVMKDLAQKIREVLE